jgi:2-polyprenyl-3-methyl-5-hydroxy-6-metoxy-1,4-benzoquinol methylase
MKIQDKQAEMEVGSGPPEDEWLEDSQGYRVRKTHLELLHLVPSQGLRILDAGCGPGTYGIMLAQEGNVVTGVEISPKAVQVANERANRKGVNFSALVGDLEGLSFEDGFFDVGFSGWVLHHFPDMNTATAELARVLKPGGKIALAEPNESNLAMRLSRFVENLPLLRRWVLNAGWDTPNRTSHRHKDYVRALEQNGFTDIVVSSCFPGGLPPLPAKSGKGINVLTINILVRLRRILFIAAFKILPPPLNGADLLVTGIKGTKT